MMGFNWLEFFGTPIPSKSSDAHSLRFPELCPWLRTESDSGSLRISAPFLTAERIYGRPIEAITMELA